MDPIYGAVGDAPVAVNPVADIGPYIQTGSSSSSSSSGCHGRVRLRLVCSSISGVMTYFLTGTRPDGTTVTQQVNGPFTCEPFQLPFINVPVADNCETNSGYITTNPNFTCPSSSSSSSISKSSISKSSISSSSVSHSSSSESMITNCCPNGLSDSLFLTITGSNTTCPCFVVAVATLVWNGTAWEGGVGICAVVVNYVLTMTNTVEGSGNCFTLSQVFEGCTSLGTQSVDPTSCDPFQLDFNGFQMSIDCGCIMTTPLTIVVTE